MQRKEKYSIDQQIQHMKKQDIKFNLYSADEAKSFLTKSNYYFKVKAFAKNYRKNKDNNKYIDLDFKYLRKFTILDTLFRDLILELSLLCEHLIKTAICYHCSENLDDDGYESVSNFLQEQENNTPKTLQRYDDNIFNFYSKELLDKYRNDLPVWVFVEILTFDELIKFYDFYTKQFNMPVFVNTFDLYAIKSLRNIAAHNNCILHTLTMIPLNNKDFKISYYLIQILQKKNLLSHNKNEIRIPVIHDFLCLILIFNDICPETEIKNIIKKKISDFFAKCEEKKEYFDNENLIKKRYKFIKKATITILS